MRHPARSPSLALLLTLLTAALPSTGSAAVDEFFETDFDGNWVGTLDLGADSIPAQVSLNVGDGVGTAMLRLPDAETGASTLFEAGFRRIKAKRLILEYEDVPEADGDAEPETVTVILRYQASQDAIQGKTRGALRGRLRLERTDPELPVGRLWSGSVRLGGQSLELLVQLSEAAPEPASRLAAGEVSGWAVLGQEQGPVSGSRNGKAVDLTLELDGGEVTADLRLARGDSQLKGRLRRAGDSARAKLLPLGSNNGKPMKVRKVVDGEVPAGATSMVRVRGKNFGLGATVHTDVPGVVAGTPTVTSPRLLDVEITVPPATPAGTEISLRVVNGDGQVDAAPGALTVADDGGGEPPLSFAADVEPIFAGNCALAGCHSAASAQQGLVLEPGLAYDNIVNVSSSQQPALNRITPGDPDNSYLVMKIRGDSGIQGGRMPLGRTPLSEAQIQTIVTWVQQGAQSNAPSR